MYKDSEIAQQIFERLAIYDFLKRDLESNSSSNRLELRSLSPELWIKWQGNALVIDTIPPESPWNFLRIGQQIGRNLRHQIHTILKRDKGFAEEWFHLIFYLREFERLEGSTTILERAYHRYMGELQSSGISSKEIVRLLEQRFPLIERLKGAGQLFPVLPWRHMNSQWLPLNAVNLEIYDPVTNALKPIGNFTLYSDNDFENIRKAYLELEKALSAKADPSIIRKWENVLAEALMTAYTPFSGQVFQKVHAKQSYYPSMGQLKIESIYLSFSWIPFLIILYSVSIFLLLASFRWIALQKGAYWLTVLALIFHSFLLLMRCYILQRPPVSNMFETVIYVPWVAVSITLLFPLFRRQPYALLAACLSAVILLLILEATQLDQRLDQVQAVLDSQFWLLIHVLMVVGSYGMFILAAVLGHFYLFFVLFKKLCLNTNISNLKTDFEKKSISSMVRLGNLILQSMYIGTGLLISGTILGGIWAAESWGRFWDWDPKESWAFISICFYLICIHAYRFGRIDNFGLAVGSITGLLAISFTWYGVNYILGTGLHSYGFGSGGEWVYSAFVFGECLFLSTVFVISCMKRQETNTIYQK